MVGMRTIIVFLVALSVAMLPLGGSIAAPGDISSNSKLAASAHDCCDHDGVPVDNTMKDCQAAAGCASKCFSLYDPMFSNPLIHPPVIRADVSLLTETFCSQESSPPFRPPRL